MSRRRALPVLAVPLLLSGCLTFEVVVKVTPDGAVERRVILRTSTREAAAKARERFPAPWVVSDTPDGLGIEARFHRAPAEDLPEGETRLRVRKDDFVLFAVFDYGEDWSLLRLGKRPPTIAPVPPVRHILAPWVTVLGHEKNLAVLERRFRESVRVTLRAELPGIVISGNEARREAGALLWEFNLRAPAAPRARTIVLRPVRIGVVAALGAGGVAVLVRVRRARRRRG